MKIIRTTLQQVTMRLREPVSSDNNSQDKITNIFIMAETDNGLAGWGCAAPETQVTGETTEMVEKAYYGVLEGLLHRADPTTFTRLNEEVKFRLPHSPAARAMIDMMLFDLVAKKAGMPLYRMLGGYSNSIPTSVTIPEMNVSDTLKKAQELVGQKFYILKLKGGRKVEEDIEKVLKLYEKYGSSISIRFDASQGYSYEQVLKFVDSTREADVDILEQPVPRENRELLGKVTRKSHITVMADESLMNTNDALQLASNDLTDMINIKLMKVGGIVESLHINSVAKAAGVECMIGSGIESALSISAGLQVALSRPNIIYADLDGHLNLIDDPAEGAVIIKNGIMYPTDEPGLGNFERIFS